MDKIAKWMHTIHSNSPGGKKIKDMRNFNYLLCVALSLALVGCGGDTPQRGSVDPPKEMFDAQLVSGLSPGAQVDIESQIANLVEVEVLVYPDDPAIAGNEVAVDYARTGWADGPDLETAQEDAAVEADQNIQVTLRSEHNIVSIDIKAGQAVPQSKDTILLHVRVPPRARLAVDLEAGNVRIWGDLTDADIHTKNGSIEVRGATGSLVLNTGHGDIRVDDLRYQSAEQGVLELTSGEGNLNIYAVNVTARARTAKGNIRFVGSLAEGLDHVFETTEGGNIILALPSDLPYTFKAFGGKQVMNDFTARTLVCGVPDGNMLNFHWQRTPSTVGHVTVGQLITTTDWVSGTLFPGNYFLFRTNRAAVAEFVPTSDTPRQQGGALWTPDCDEPARENELANIRFTAKTGKTGIIEVRLIRKHE
jgi:hypothetical protein